MRAALALLFLAVASCGSDSTAPSVQLTAAGASPSTTSVNSAGTLRFVNQDTAAHQLSSSDCAELDSPKLAAGAEFIAQLGAGPKTCAYVDSLNPSATAFHGTVNVLAPNPGGGGGPGY